MNIRIQRRKIPDALVILFLLLLTAKDFTGVTVPSMVFTFLWLLILLFADDNTSTAFTLSSVICFANILSITIPCVFYTVLNLYRRKAIIADAIFIVSLYVAFIEIIRFLSIDGENFRHYMNSMSVLFLVYTAITNLRTKKASPELCLKYYLAFFTILSLDIIWATAKLLGGVGSIISGGFRIGQVDILEESAAGIFSINANGIALMSILAITSVMLLRSKKHIISKYAIPMLAYFTVVGLLTVSKTFFLVYSGFWALYTCWYFSKNNKNILKPLCLIFVFVIIAVRLWNTDIIQNVIARFDTNDLTTGRVDIAFEYMEFMKQHGPEFILGIGLQNVTGKTHLLHVPHNAILEIFVCFGLVGIVAYIFFFIALIHSAVRIYKAENAYDKHIVINLLPFITFIVFIQSLQFLRINYIYTLIPITYAALIVSEPQEKDPAVKVNGGTQLEI